jgi:hypothetical protein
MCQILLIDQTVSPDNYLEATGSFNVSRYHSTVGDGISA